MHRSNPPIISICQLITTIVSCEGCARWGEFVVTQQSIEGTRRGAIYRAAARPREYRVAVARYVTTPGRALSSSVLHPLFASARDSRCSLTDGLLDVCVWTMGVSDESEPLLVTSSRKKTSTTAAKNYSTLGYVSVPSLFWPRGMGWVAGDAFPTPRVALQ